MTEEVIAGAAREGDIYRQYAMTVIACNAFRFDKYTEPHTLIRAQEQLSLLGAIANQYMLKRVGTAEDESTKKRLADVEKLIKCQKWFVELVVNDKKEKPDYDKIKARAMKICDDYDRLLLEIGIFK
jgi:hypothetical protein